MSSFYQKTLFVFTCLVLGIAAMPEQGSSGGGYSSGGGSGYSGGSGHGGHSGYSQEPSYPPRPYNFKYDVNDHYSGANFGQREKSDGQNVNGEYRVKLPDGRTQIVTYNADWQHGFNADVKYQGEAQYPHTSGGNGHGHGHGQSSGYAQPAHTGYSGSTGAPSGGYGK